MKVEQAISPEDLRRHLIYDAETGRFTRRSDGKSVGWQMTNGYRGVGIGQRQLYEHRAAYAYVHGAWPEAHIDHINGDRTDNRIVNLRSVPRAVNMQNIRKPHKDSSTGLLGVTWNQTEMRFIARIVVDGKAWRKRFTDANEAHTAYLAKKRELHPGSTI